MLKQYNNRQISVIKDDTIENEVSNIFIEPNVWNEIKSYFHYGENHPSSRFEQQMGLMGYKIRGINGEDDYIVRYTSPSYTERLASDLAVFNSHTLRQVDKELKIIRKSLNSLDKKMITYQEHQYS